MESGAVQCGFCTPGLVVATADLLAHNPEPSEYEIREALSGNLCRCTGLREDLRRRAARGGARMRTNWHTIGTSCVRVPRRFRR